MNKLYGLLPVTTPAQKIAKDNCIAIFLVGSHLYGTSTPESDFDYEGWFIEPPAYVIGNGSCLEVDFSTKSPSKFSERNTPKDIDCKLYSLRNFFGLAMKSNPNKLEHFFIPDRNIVYKNDAFYQRVIDAKDLFISLRSKHSFQGYAHSQKKKLLTKKLRLEELREFHLVLEKGLVDCDQPKVTIGDIFSTNWEAEEWPYKYILKSTTEEGTPAIRIQEKEFNFGMDAQVIYEHVGSILGRYGNRTLSLDERGYDCKFASHLFRLYYEGLQLLKEGTMEFPLVENKFLLSVKEGKYDLDYLLKRADEFEPLFEMAYLQSPLQKGPQQDKISKLQQEMYLEWWREHKLI